MLVSEKSRMQNYVDRKKKKWLKEKKRKLFVYVKIFA